MIAVLAVGLGLAVIIALWFSKQRIVALDWEPNRVSRIRSSADNSPSVNYSRPAPPSNVVIHEHAPYPYACYPGKYGSFCAFAEHEGGDPVLCLCSLPSIMNLRKFQENWSAHKIFDLSDAVFSSSRQLLPDFSYSRFLPAVLARFIGGQKPPQSELDFKSGLCHRCNLSVPAIQYCHRDFASGFVSRYGWYVNQKYLTLGILPVRLGIGPARFTFFLYVDAERPKKLQELIANQRQSQEDYFLEHHRLVALIDGPWRKDIREHERYFAIHAHSNLSIAEAANYAQHRSKLGRAAGTITRYVENLVRPEFGHGKIGDHWINETILYQIVRQIFAGRKVERHYRPGWLGGLELDIYFPELHLAIEYQGEQHFHPIKAWGGESALRSLQERDQRKQRLCRENRVKLVHINYTDPLTEEYIRRVLKGP